MDAKDAVQPPKPRRKKPGKRERNRARKAQEADRINKISAAAESFDFKEGMKGPMAYFKNIDGKMHTIPVGPISRPDADVFAKNKAILGNLVDWGIAYGEQKVYEQIMKQMESQSMNENAKAFKNLLESALHSFQSNWRRLSEMYMKTLQQGSELTAQIMSEQVKEKEKLKDEKAKENEKQLCCICIEKPKGIVFNPCGHNACCEVCSKDLKTCPVCRANIASGTKLFVV